MTKPIPVFHRHKPSEPRRSAWGMTIFTSLALMALGAVLGITGDRFRTHSTQSELQSQVIELQATVTQLQQDLAVSQSTLNVELAAKEQFANDLVQARQKMAQLREDLTFFELLIPQEGTKNTMQIRSAEALQLAPDSVTFKLLLMRLNRSDEPFSGEVHFSALGTVKGKPKTVELSLLPTGDDVQSNSQAMPVSFQQYTRLEGILKLPDDFSINKLNIQLVKNGNVLSSTSVPVIKQ